MEKQTPQTQQHCDHECVCVSVPQIERARNEPCNTHGTRAHCLHDTRSRPAPAAPEKELFSETTLERVRREATAKAREDVLKEVQHALDIEQIRTESSFLHVNNIRTVVESLRSNTSDKEGRR